MTRTARMSPTYRLAMAVCTPAIRWWGRLEVQGLEHLPADGPVLLAVNHDSHWDPVAVGVAGQARRQVCALAKASMWERPLLGRVLDGMGQIPIHALALQAATQALHDGVCIGVFPEGTLSFGNVLRARSGIGRLAQSVPEAQIVCCTVQGTVDLVRFPRRRPRIRVAFFAPAGGPPEPGETAPAFAQRLLDELRTRAPRAKAGRRPSGESIV